MRRTQLVVAARQRRSSCASRCRRSSPTPVTRCWPQCSSATRHSTPWPKGSTAVHDVLRRPHVRQRDRDDHRHADVPDRHQRLPAGRHARARRHRRAGDDGDPARRVQGPLAAAAAGRHGGRHRLGLRCVRLHRHQAVARHDRRPADPHRPRHRVRDPDPEPDRGGTRPRAFGQSVRGRRCCTWARRWSRRRSPPSSRS